VNLATKSLVALAISIFAVPAGAEEITAKQKAMFAEFNDAFAKGDTDRLGKTLSEDAELRYVIDKKDGKCATGAKGEVKPKAIDVFKTINSFLMERFEKRELATCSEVAPTPPHMVAGSVCAYNMGQGVVVLTSALAQQNQSIAGVFIICREEKG